MSVERLRCRGKNFRDSLVLNSLGSIFRAIQCICERGALTREWLSYRTNPPHFHSGKAGHKINSTIKQEWLGPMRKALVRAIKFVAKKMPTPLQTESTCRLISATGDTRFRRVSQLHWLTVTMELSPQAQSSYPESAMLQCQRHPELHSHSARGELLLQKRVPLVEQRPALTLTGLLSWQFRRRP